MFQITGPALFNAGPDALCFAVANGTVRLEALMKRREFIALLGGAVAAAPLAAHAQQRPKKIPRIGIIDDGPIWQPFRDAMRAAGYVEGRTIAYEYRSSGGDPARLSAAATELVALPVDVLATYGTPPSRAAKAATSTIPIVMLSVGDPVGAGLVKSLAHPGGNVTGNTIISPDLAPKRLQLIKEIMPSASRVALLWNPDNMSSAMNLNYLRASAPEHGLAFTAVEARTAGDLEGAMTTLARERTNVVLVTNDPLHQSNIQKIISLLFQHGLPGMFQNRESVAAGGLMSYGPSLPALFRQGAFFVHKILQGTRPADLPVQTPQQLELTINLKAAKALGVTISEAVLLRADHVIE
jgi:putative ABC transport system substrate-binding protein